MPERHPLQFRSDWMPSVLIDSSRSSPPHKTTRPAQDLNPFLPCERLNHRQVFGCARYTLEGCIGVLHCGVTPVIFGEQECRAVPCFLSAHSVEPQAAFNLGFIARQTVSHYELTRTDKKDDEPTGLQEPRRPLGTLADVIRCQHARVLQRGKTGPGG